MLKNIGTGLLAIVGGMLVIVIILLASGGLFYLGWNFLGAPLFNEAVISFALAFKMVISMSIVNMIITVIKNLLTKKTSPF